jgi:hypothetical protein
LGDVQFKGGILLLRLDERERVMYPKFKDKNEKEQR